MAKKTSIAEKKFARYWLALGGQKYRFDEAFHHSRKWRFDFKFEDAMVAVEIEGGVFMGKFGGHTSGVGYTDDCEKYNEAIFAGWTVFRLTPAQINIENLTKIKDFIKKALDKRKN